MGGAPLSFPSNAYVISSPHSEKYWTLNTKTIELKAMNRVKQPLQRFAVICRPFWLWELGELKRTSRKIVL
jgi:hypothetical protein